MYNDIQKTKELTNYMMHKFGYSKEDLSQIHSYMLNGVPDTKEDIDKYVKYMLDFDEYCRKEKEMIQKKARKIYNIEELPYKTKLFNSYKRNPILNSFYLQNAIFFLIILFSLMFWVNCIYKFIIIKENIYLLIIIFNVIFLLIKYNNRLYIKTIYVQVIKNGVRSFKTKKQIEVVTNESKYFFNFSQKFLTKKSIVEIFSHPNSIRTVNLCFIEHLLDLIYHFMVFLFLLINYNKFLQYLCFVLFPNINQLYIHIIVYYFLVYYSIEIMHITFIYICEQDFSYDDTIHSGINRRKPLPENYDFTNRYNFYWMRPQMLIRTCGKYINTKVKSIIHKILIYVGFFKKITGPIYYKGIAKLLNIDMTHEKYFWYSSQIDETIVNMASFIFTWPCRLIILYNPLTIIYNTIIRYHPKIKDTYSIFESNYTPNIYHILVTRFIYNIIIFIVLFVIL